MARKHAMAASTTAGIVAFALLALQLYEATQQIGRAFGSVSNEVGITRSSAPEPVSHTQVSVEHEDRSEALRIVALEVTPNANEPTAENADDSLELPPSPDEEADLLATLQRALNDPDPEIRSEAAAVLGIGLSEENALIPLRNADAPAVGGPPDSRTR